MASITKTKKRVANELKVNKAMGNSSQNAVKGASGGATTSGAGKLLKKRLTKKKSITPTGTRNKNRENLYY